MGGGRGYVYIFKQRYLIKNGGRLITFNNYEKKGGKVVNELKLIQSYVFVIV